MTDRPCARPLERLLSGLALAALLAVPTALAAQTADGAGEPPAAPGFAAIDTDGDGTISPEEWQAMLDRLPPQMRGLLAAGAPDMSTPEARRAAFIAARFAALDTDGDGMISPEEFAAGIEARAERRAGMRGERRPEARRDWREGRMKEMRQYGRDGRWGEGRDPRWPRRD